MSPRILDLQQCSHCDSELPQPTPRTCPACGGSLQKRYLSTGCLTSKPLLMLLATSVCLGAAAVHLTRIALAGA